MEARYSAQFAIKQVINAGVRMLCLDTAKILRVKNGPFLKWPSCVRPTSLATPLVGENLEFRRLKLSCCFLILRRVTNFVAVAPPTPDPCAMHPCLNGGRCVLTVSGEIGCRCMPYYHGRICENRSEFRAVKEICIERTTFVRKKRACSLVTFFQLAGSRKT